MVNGVYIEAMEQCGISCGGLFPATCRLDCRHACEGPSCGLGEEYLLVLEILLVVAVERQAEAQDALAQAPGFHGFGDDDIHPVEISGRGIAQARDFPGVGVSGDIARRCCA